MTRDHERPLAEDAAECAICTFHGHDPEPLAVAYEIDYDAGRDGLPWRQVYACPECYRQGTPEPGALADKPRTLARLREVDDG